MADPATLVSRLRETWRRTDALFELIQPDALLERPIPLRHPFLFYLGHLPAFAWNQVCRGALGRESFAPELDALFERGIDPSDVRGFAAPDTRWPGMAETLEYRDRVRDALVVMSGEAVERDAAHVLERAIEHELMHQETLLYMTLQLPHDRKRPPEAAAPSPRRGAAAAGSVEVPAGPVTLGAPRNGAFGWDNEFPERELRVPAFRVDALPVRNGEFLEFVEAGGYHTPELWTPEAWAWREAQRHDCPRLWSRREGEWVYRTLFEDVPLADVADWPVYVTWAAARAYARWRARRLATEAEYQRAAHADPAGELRSHPWGEAAPTGEHGNFGFRAWTPTPVGTHPAGASAWGVQDLVGDGWEWTATPFGPHPGFEPMPGYEGYSSDFFDGRHYVLLGASWATDDSLVRRSFRNWFQPHYPYVFAKFRCAKDAAA